jgi:hypothetical protein
MISPRGFEPAAPAWYLSWPAWEAFRIERLGQAPPPEGLSPLMIGSPEGFAASLAQLLRSASDAPAAVSGPPLAGFGDQGRLRRALLSGGRAEPPAGLAPRTPPHLALALWAAAESLAMDADEMLGEALGRRRRLMSELSGPDGGPDESAPDLSAPDESAPPSETLFPAAGPTRLPAGGAGPILAAWLALAGPVLRPGDRLWSPRPELAEPARGRLAEAAPGVFLAPAPGGPPPF